MNRQRCHRGSLTAADIPAALTADAALVSAAAAAAELVGAVSCLSQARLQLEETLYTHTSPPLPLAPLPPSTHQ